MQSVKVELKYIALQVDRQAIIGLILILETEQLLEGTWYDTWLLIRALNCKSLTRACLSIGKDAHVVAIDSTLHQHLRILKYLILGRILVEASIESVRFLLVDALTRRA